MFSDSLQCIKHQHAMSRVKVNSDYTNLFSLIVKQAI